MKAREFKELTTKELQECLEAEKENLLRLKLNHTISPLDNPSQIREVRKTIARLNTELCQRELNQQ